MDKENIKCTCGKKFLEEEFEKHYYNCQPFKKLFKEFDMKIAFLIKAYSQPEENLLIIIFLLKQYIKSTEKKLNKCFANLRKNEPHLRLNNERNVPLSLEGGNLFLEVRSKNLCNEKNLQNQSNNNKSKLFQSQISNINPNIQNSYNSINHGFNYQIEKYLKNIPISIPTSDLIIILNQTKNCIKIDINNSFATGFFCLIPFPDKFNLLPCLITNWHVLSENDIIVGKK